MPDVQHSEQCHHPEDHEYHALEAHEPHQHDDPAQRRVRQFAARLVLLMALGLAVLSFVDPASGIYAAKIFLGITVEAAPWIVAAALLTLGMEYVLRDDWLPRVSAKMGWLGLPLVVVAAPLIPTCECGVVVVLRGLLRKGLPIPHAITFLLIAPILHPLVFLSTWVAFADLHMALWRSAIGIVVALAVGTVFWRLQPEQALLPGEGCSHHHHPQAMGLGARAERVLGDSFDTLLFFLFGVGLATALRVIIPVSTLDGVGGNALFAPAVTMTLAFVASLCSEADAFLAAGFHGFTWTAILAFLVFGPMCDIKLILMLRTVLRPLLIVKIMTLTALLVYALTVLMGLIT